MTGFERVATALQNRVLGAFDQFKPEFVPSGLSVRCPLSLRGARITWPARYDWPQAVKWVGSLRRGLASVFDVQTLSLPQATGTVSFTVALGSDQELVVVDYADRPGIDEALAGKALAYFKMQYRLPGYDHPAVIPGGFVPNDSSIYRLIGTLRNRSEVRHDVYSRFGLEFAPDVRTRAIETLRDTSEFRFAGGLHKVPYRRFLQECAESAVCLDLPGNGDLCFRLIDFLALGCCVVSPRHESVLHERLENGKQIVYCREDLSDLVDVCARYVRDADARRRVGHGAARFFDQHLHWMSLTNHYIEEIARRWQVRGTN